MSGKLPAISGRELIKILAKAGYVPVRQRGSHIRLEHTTDPERKKITVPDHPVIGKGLIHKILRDAGLTLDEFIKILD
jgi:predicted RNA binding protein YcfA (HicA-like mRNA interferase family)